jgi:hypothetical protein
MVESTLRTGPCSLAEIPPDQAWWDRSQLLSIAAWDGQGTGSVDRAVAATMATPPHLSPSTRRQSDTPAPATRGRTRIRG